MSRDIMETIRNSDPDGYMTRPPTERDYQIFKEWVIREFGTDVWADYQGNWDTTENDGDYSDTYIGDDYYSGSGELMGDDSYTTYLNHV